MLTVRVMVTYMHVAFDMLINMVTRRWYKHNWCCSGLLNWYSAEILALNIYKVYNKIIKSNYMN